MKKTLIIAFFLAVAMMISGCGSNEAERGTPVDERAETNDTDAKQGVSAAPDVQLPQFDQVVPSEDTIVTLKTSKGDIQIKLFPQYAPKAVENFVTHSKNGYYNGLTFHRVMNDFMIQGGDPEGNGTGGESIWKAPFEDEFTPELVNFRGALAMANSGANTNGSQFFIVQAQTVDEELVEQMRQSSFPNNVIEKYIEVGGTPWLDYKHTVFGQVFEGMEVVDEIASVKVDSTTSAPIEPVYINEVIVQE